MSKFKTGLRILASSIAFNKLRLLLFKLSGTKIGKNGNIIRGTRIGRDVKIGNNLSTGKNVFLGNFSEIGNNVVIEDDVIIARVKIGNNTFIHKGSIIYGNPKDKLKIGNYCFIGFYAVLDGTEKLEIGDSVHIAGPCVGIFTHSSINNCLMGIKPKTEKYENNQIKKSVKIENNVWIGGKVTIYPGIKVGHHSAILPNSVVNRDVEPYSIVGGLPAKLKKRLDINEIKISNLRVDK